MYILSSSYLQLLVMKLVSVILHIASYKWESICEWIIEKRKIQLLTDNLEAMSKIHSYYIANSKSELPNYSKDEPLKNFVQF